MEDGASTHPDEKPRLREGQAGLAAFSAGVMGRMTSSASGKVNGNKEAGEDVATSGGPLTKCKAAVELAVKEKKTTPEAVGDRVTETAELTDEGSEELLPEPASSLR